MGTHRAEFRQIRDDLFFGIDVLFKDLYNQFQLLFPYRVGIFKRQMQRS